MNPRSYRSPVREAAAGETRARIVAAAGALLGEVKGSRAFSLEAVAKKAGVTRLTVYKQFGSRRALLEEVFDDVSVRGGLGRIVDAMADTDSHRALRHVISIFCDFWSVDTLALARLRDAGAGDREFEESVRERNERRRQLLSALVSRMAGSGHGRARSHKDLIDVLFALTSFDFFAQLTSGGRTARATCRLLQALCEDAVRHAGLGPD